MKDSPPNSPPQSSLRLRVKGVDEEERQAEKIYISFLKSERAKNAQNPVASELEKVVSSRREERESSQDIYKNLNTVIFTDSGKLVRRRGSYKRTAVKDRIRRFLNDFEELFPIGSSISKQELTYWIQRLNLANDRLAVRQYLKRLVMHGYFSARNGSFTFESKNPKQWSLNELLNVQSRIQKLRAVTRKTRRRRAW